MNNQGQVRGFAYILVFMIVALTLFGLIEVFKEVLDNNRGSDNEGLNCPGTITFNATDYADDNALEKLTRRPTCFVTGISMTYFIFSVLIAAGIWVVANWRKK